MNKTHIRNLAEKSGIELTSNGFNVYTEFASLGDLEKFAHLIYEDIITVVAAQALLNESAVDVFQNLKSIYGEDTK